MGGNVIAGLEVSGRHDSICGNCTDPWANLFSGDIKVEVETSCKDDLSWSQIQSLTPGFVKSILEMYLKIRGISQDFHKIGMIFRHLSSKHAINTKNRIY